MNNRTRKSDEIDISLGIRTAILIDGSFFLKRYRSCFPPPHDDPVKAATDLYSMCHSHVENKYLYRIFYYDCKPFTKKVHNPISGRCIDFSKTDAALFRYEFYKQLIRKRKVALRLGELHDGGKWMIKPGVVKSLLKGDIQAAEITDNDITYDLKQKGVDIKIGADIAALSYKKLVDRIILVTGDSDFVPAAKVARREGIDFVLDPMFNHIKDELFEHIDGLDSKCRRP